MFSVYVLVFVSLILDGLAVCIRVYMPAVVFLPINTCLHCSYTTKDIEIAGATERNRESDKTRLEWLVNINPDNEIVRPTNLHLGSLPFK